MKSVTLGLALLVGTLLASALGAGPPGKQALTDQNFVGRVRQLDYLARQGWTQVLFQPDLSPKPSASTKSELLQQILETALLNSAEVHGTYRAGKAGDPVDLQTVILRVTSPCSEKWCVEELSCSAEKEACSARINSESTEVTTNNARAVGVLLTAITKQKAVDYLELEKQSDKQSLIVRVQIGVP